MRHFTGITEPSGSLPHVQQLISLALEVEEQTVNFSTTLAQWSDHVLKLSEPFFGFLSIFWPGCDAQPRVL